MAQPSTEVNHFRNRMNNLTDAFRSVEEVLAIIEDFGTNDAERQAFFQAVFTDYDITWSEFAAGIVALRAMRTAWNTNKTAMVKLRI